MDVTQMEGVSGGKGGAGGGGGGGGGFTSNLTTMEQSLRSSYADIAFGRNSPCPPGNLPEDGGRDAEEQFTRLENPLLVQQQQQQPRGEEVFTAETVESGNAEQYRPSRPVRQNKQQQYLQESQKFGKSQQQPVSAYAGESEKGRPTARRKRRPYEGSKSARGLLLRDTPRGERQRYEAGSGSGAGAGYSGAPERPASCSPTRRVKGQPESGSCTVVVTGDRGEPMPRPSSVDLIAMDDSAIGMSKLESSRSISSSLWSNDGRCPSYAEVFFGAGGGQHSTSRSLDSLSNVEQMPEDNVPVQMVSPSEEDRQGFEPTADLLKQQVQEIVSFVEEASSQLQRDEQEMRGLEQQQQYEQPQQIHQMSQVCPMELEREISHFAPAGVHHQQQQQMDMHIMQEPIMQSQQQQPLQSHHSYEMHMDSLMHEYRDNREEEMQNLATAQVVYEQQQQQRQSTPPQFHEQRQSTPPQPPQRQHSPPQQQQQQQQYQASAPPQEDSGSKLSYASILAVNMPEKPLEMEEQSPSHGSSRRKRAPSPPLYSEGHSEPIILLPGSEPGAQDTEGDARESTLESEIAFKHPTIPGLIFKKESANLLAPSPMPRRRRRRSGRSRSKSLHTSEADDDSDDEDKQESAEQNLQSQGDPELQAAGASSKPTRPSRKRKPHKAKQLHKAVSEPDIPKSPMHHHQYSHEPPTHDDDIEIPDELAYGDRDNDDISESQSRSCDVGYVSGPTTQASEDRARSETPSEITKEGFADAETDAAPISEAGTSSHQKAKKKKKPKKKPHEEEDEIERALRDIEQMEKAKKQPHKGISLDTAPSFDDSEMSYGKVEMSGESAAASVPTESVEQSPRPERRQRKGKNKLQQQQQRQDTLEETGGSSLDLAGGEQAVVEHVDVLSEALLETYEKLDSGAATVRDPADIPVALELVEGEQKKEGNEEQGGDAPVATKRTKKNKKGEKKQGKGKQDEQVAQQTDTDGQAPKEEKLEGDEMAVKVEKQLVESVDSVSENNGSAPLITPVVVEGDINTSIGTDVTSTATTSVAGDATGEPEIGYLLSKSERLDEFPMTVISPEPQKEVVIEPEQQQQQKMEASVNEKDSSAPLVFNAPEETSNQQKDEQEKQQQQKPPKRKKRKAKKSESESIDESGPSEVESQVQQEQALPQIEKPVETVQEQQPPPEVEKLVEIEPEQPQSQVEKVAEQSAPPTEKLVETVPPVEQPKPFALVKKEDELWDAWMDDDVCPIEDDFEDSTPVIQPITTTETVQVAPEPKESVQPVQEQKQQESEKVGEAALTQPTFGLLKTTDPFDDFWMNDEPCPIEDDVEDQIVDPMAEQMKLFAPDSVKDEKTEVKDKEEEKQAIITPVKSEETPKKEEKAGGFNLLKSSDPWDDLWMDDEPCPIIDDDEEEQQQQNGAQIEAASSLESQPASNKASQVDAQQRETGEGEEIQSGLIPAATPAITPTVEETTPKGITTESQEGEQMAVATTTTAAAIDDQPDQKARSKENKKKGGSGTKGGKSGESKVEKQDAPAEVTHPSESKSGSKGSSKKWSGGSKQKQKGIPKSATDWKTKGKGEEGLSGQEQESAGEWETVAEEIVEPTTTPASEGAVLEESSNNVSVVPHMEVVETLLQTAAEEAVEFTVQQKDEEMVLGDNTSPVLQGEEAAEAEEIKPGKPIKRRDTKKKLKRPAFVGSEAQEKIAPEGESSRELIELSESSAAVISTEPQTEIAIKQEDIDQTAVAGSEVEKKGGEQEGNKIIDDDRTTEMASRIIDEGQSKQDEQAKQQSIEEDLGREKKVAAIEKEKAQSEVEGDNSSNKKGKGGKKGGENKGKKGGKGKMEETETEVGQTQAPGSKRPQPPQRRRTKSKNSDSESEIVEQSSPVIPQKELQIEAIEEISGQELQFASEPAIGKGKQKRKRTKSKNSESEDVPESTKAMEQETEAVVAATEPVAEEVLKPETVEESAAGALPELEFSMEPAVGKGKQRRRRTKSKNSESEDQPEAQLPIEQAPEVVKTEKIVESATIPEAKAEAATDELDFAMEPAKGKGKQKRKRTKSKNSESEDSPVTEQVPQPEPEKQESLSSPPTSLTTTEEFTSITSTTTTTEPESELPFEPVQKGKGKQQRKQKKEKPQNQKSRNSESESDNQSTSQEIKAEVAPVQESIPEVATAQEASQIAPKPEPAKPKETKKQQQQQKRKQTRSKNSESEEAAPVTSTTTTATEAQAEVATLELASTPKEHKQVEQSPLISLEETQPSQEKTESSSKEDEKEKVVAAGEPDSGETARRNKAKQKRKRNQTRNSECEPEEGAESGSVVPGKSPETEEKSQLAEQTSTVSLSSSSEQPSEAKQEQKESKAEEPSSSSSPASATAPLSTCAKKEKSQQGNNNKKGSSTPTFKERKASDSSRSQSFSVTEEPSHDEQQEKSERSHSVSEVALSAATVVLAAAAEAAIPTTGDETTTATESKVISQVEDKQEAINKSEQNDSEVISQKVEPAVVEVVVDVQQTTQPEPVKQTDYKLKTDDVFGDAWMDDDVCPVADDDEEDTTNEVQQPKEESVLTTTAVEKVEATVEVKEEPKKSEVAPVVATEQKPVSFALKTDDIFGDAWMDDEAMVIDVSDGDEEVTKSPEKSAVTSTVEVEIVSAPNKLEETAESKPEQVSEKEEKKEEKRVRFPPDEELSEEKLISTKEGKGGKKKRRKPQKSKAAEEAEKTLAGLESGHSSQDETSALSHDESQTDPESGVDDDGFMVFQSRKTKLKGKRAQDEDEEDKKEDDEEKKIEVEEEVATSVAPLATPESPEKVAEVVEAVVTSSSPAEEQKEEIAVVSIDTVALASEEPTLTHAAQDMEALLAGEVDSLQLSSIETLPDSQEDKEEPEASVSFAKDVTIIQYDDEAEPSTVTFATLREYSRRSSLPDEGKDVKAPPQMQESPSLDESPPETPVEPQAVALEVKPAEQIKEQSVVATGENLVEVEIKEQPKAKEEQQSPEVATEEKRENSAIQPTTLHAMSSQIISQLDFQEAESRWHAYITQQRNRQQKSDAPPQEIGGQEEKPIAKPLENVTNAIKLENEAKSAKSTAEAPVPEPSAEVKEVEETPVTEPAIVTEVIPDVSTSRKPVVVETHQKTTSSNKPLSYAQVAASPQKVQKQPSLTENLEALLETARITQYLVFQEAERTYQEYRAQQPSPPPATQQEEEQKDETTAEGNVPSVPENEPVSPPKADVEVSSSSSNKSRPLVEAAQEVSKMVEQLASEIKALSTPPPEPSQEYLEPKTVTATPPPSPEPPAAAPLIEPSSSTTTAGEPTSPQLNDSQQDPFLLQMVSFNEAERKWREGLDKQKQQQEEPEASSSNHPPGSDDPDGSNNQDPPSSDGGGDRGRRGNKPPVTELLLGGLSNLSCNWLDWSTYLSPEIKLPGKLAFPSPTSAGGAPVFPTPQVEEVDVSTGATSPATEETRVEQQEGRVDADDLKKIKEESQADVDELGKAINAAAEKLSNLDPEQLEQTLHKTWELLGGLKDLEGSGLTLKDNVDSNFPAEDPDAKTMSTELKELLSRLVVLMAQTEKLNKATKVNESVDKEQQGRTSCPYLNIASSPSHPLSDDENGRRSPEGSCASAGLTMLTPTSGVSATTLMKSPSGSRLIETGESSQKWFTNGNTPGDNGKSGSGCHGNQGQFLAHQCGCCGAPILISILSPNDFPQREQQQQYLLRENFYRLNQTSTTAGHQFHHNNNNQYHHLQQDGVFH